MICTPIEPQDHGRAQQANLGSCQQHQMGSEAVHLCHVAEYVCMAVLVQVLGLPVTYENDLWQLLHDLLW